MKKALIIATVPSMIGQFNMNNIQVLQELGYEVHVACNFKDRSVWTNERVQEFINELGKKKVKKHQIVFSRNPLKIKKHYKAFKVIRKLLKKESITLMHCHTPIASAISRLAAKDLNEVKVIYTAHGFHFFKGAPIRNWLIYYPIEKIMSKYTDVLITINKEDYFRGKKNFSAKKVEYIPGVGIDLEKIQKICVDRKKKRDELNIKDDDIVLLSVGELSKRKNHEIVIKALGKIGNPRIKYLICGKGVLEQRLLSLSKENSVEKQVQLLGFRTDVLEICACADIFIFPSLQEGLPVALMEAMACGLPCIASNIRGNVDLIQDRINGYVVKHNVVEEYIEGIKFILHLEKHESINKKKIQETMKKFDVKIINERMKKIYELFNNA